MKTRVNVYISEKRNLKEPVAKFDIDPKKWVYSKLDQVHLWCITSGASPPVHHLWCIISGASAPVHHLCRITSGASPLVHQPQCITSGASNLLHHLCCIKFAASPLSLKISSENFCKLFFNSPQYEKIIFFFFKVQLVSKSVYKWLLWLKESPKGC